MPCYHPLKGFRAKSANPSGKRSIVFRPQEGFHDLPVTLPCGRCIGCRLERSRQWAIRCVHEASLYEDNCFITLTYSPEHLPPGGSLKVEDFQKFMKRLRFHHSEKSESRIRFFHCGEYGELNKRPHYHACLFNYDFSDKTHWKTINDIPLYRSQTLEELWPYGHASVGTLTFDSAAYVARYITKKITGPYADGHYTSIDEKTGEVIDLKPEYATMSRRPGIGRDWVTKWKSDVYPDDFIVLREKKLRVPRAYDAYLEAEFPDEFKFVKAMRQLASMEHADDPFSRRLEVKEFLQIEKYKQLHRKYENET